VLLRLIDGVYNQTRKLYILTTNQLTLNDNLLGRPGRIRYRFEFGNLKPKAVKDYIDDNLLPEYSDQRESILEQVDLLEISTIDILKALVDEVNIHGCLPEIQCLNIPTAKFAFEILEFHNQQSYADKEAVMAFIKEKLHESGFASVLEWVNEWKSENKEDDALDLLDEEFGYVTKRVIKSSFSSLFKEESTSDGIIVQEVDPDGFFVMRLKYWDTDHLCLLLRKKNNPSLYRGGLL
jgi:hypothetical protein